jgi:protein-tyrosine phosphatase
MVDLHQHLAYEMDDGAQSEAMAAQMLAASFADGVHAVCVTPHIWPGMLPFDRQGYDEKLNRLRQICDAKHPDLRLYPGAEMLYTDAAPRHLLAGKVPTLADSRFVLTEFPLDIPYAALLDAVIVLATAGYVPVLAHVERYQCLVADADRAQTLRNAFAVRFQVNAAEILRPRTWRTKRFLRQMLAGQSIDYVASDAHDTGSRKTCMTACRAQLTEGFGAEYAMQITEGNQREIFAQEPGQQTR